MKTNFSVLFFLKKPKNYKKGAACFIYLRITVDGVRAEMATSRSCEPERWNSKAGKVNGIKEDVKTLNNYLDNMKAEVYAAHTLLSVDGTEITAESVKYKYLGKEEKTHTILEAIKDHNEKMGALVEKDEYADGTLRRFEVLERHVTEFLAFKYNKSDLNIKQVNYEFISEFDFFLRTEKANDTNTAIKHVKNFGKIVRICVRNKWIIDDPFTGYKLKGKPVHRECLDANELQKIIKKKFTTSRLSQVRDFFLFSCYTGLSYADVQKLKLSDIGIGVDGERWIFSQRKKTDTRLAIPLLPMAAKILDKYSGSPVCISQNRALPISSNQKMNEYLVEIAALSGVAQTLGNRIAKRTFATTILLRNGVPIETVSKLLGHTNLRTTMLYVKITDFKVSEDMACLMAKPGRKQITKPSEVTEVKISADMTTLRALFASMAPLAAAS